MNRLKHMECVNPTRKSFLKKGEVYLCEIRTSRMTVVVWELDSGRFLGTFGCSRFKEVTNEKNLDVGIKKLKQKHKELEKLKKKIKNKEAEIRAVYKQIGKQLKLEL